MTPPLHTLKAFDPDYHSENGFYPIVYDRNVFTMFVCRVDDCYQVALFDSEDNPINPHPTTNPEREERDYVE